MTPRTLRVLWEASCLVDARNDAGIGRYARELRAAFAGVNGVEVIVASPKRPPWSEARPVRFLHAQGAVLRRALSVRPDVLHGLGGEPVAGFPPQRQVVTIHDIEMWRTGWPPGPAGVALRRYGEALARRLRRCAAVIAVSRASAEEAVATLGIDSERIAIVPQGVSAVFSAQPEPDDLRIVRGAGLEPGGYLLWIGSLRHRDPRKGLDVLLDAVARISPSGAGKPGGRNGHTLALVGAVGAEADRLVSVASLIGAKLRVVGPRDDRELAALYRQTASVVLASNHEGFGLPILEAMACGAPIVTTAVGNVPDLSGSAAVLVPPRDPAALAGAIRSVLEDPSRSKRMREAGVARAAAFTWDRTAQMTLDVYRAVVEENRARASNP